MTIETNTSLPVDQQYFPPDEKKDMQVKFKEHVQDIAGNIIATNKNDSACYENAPVMEIAKEDFDFYMQVFACYETDKKKRAECQKKYFQNNKKTYYERQKKWRDGHKVDLNKKRRERYAQTKKLKITCDESPPPQSVLPSAVEDEEVVEVVDSVDGPGHQPFGKDDGEACL
jgi:hypothetical protein